jgi:hypothetical protein
MYSYTRFSKKDAATPTRVLFNGLFSITARPGLIIITVITHLWHSQSDSNQRT